MAVVAILLAAGESTRMGSPKPLLPWGNLTLIEYQLQQLTAAGVSQIIVVLGHRAEEIKGYVKGDGVQVMINQEYRQGRATSVRAGAVAAPDDAEAILMLNIDQPRPSGIIERLITAHLAGDNVITAPVYEGRRGHPTVFAGRLLPELRAVTEEAQGLREVILRHSDSIQEAPIDDPIVLVNLNTPQDYQAALARYSPADSSS